VRGALEIGRYTPPSPAELSEQLKVPPKSVQRAIELLIDRGEVRAIQPGEIYLAQTTYEAARNAIVQNCETHKSLDIPSLRDQLQTTRKFLIPLLEHFDAAGVTIRQGANRVLRRR
jgi:selenocysteine-specific elongation factor